MRPDLAIVGIRMPPTHAAEGLTKLNLHVGDDDHRHVLAAITFLKAR